MQVRWHSSNSTKVIKEIPQNQNLESCKQFEAETAFILMEQNALKNVNNYLNTNIYLLSLRDI
jgi:hypothetical protein